MHKQYTRAASGRVDYTTLSLPFPFLGFEGRPYKLCVAKILVNILPLAIYLNPDNIFHIVPRACVLAAVQCGRY